MSGAGGNVMPLAGNASMEVGNWLVDGMGIPSSGVTARQSRQVLFRTDN
jgi:hypothetical protein